MCTYRPTAMKPYSQQRATGISASLRMSILLTLHQHHFRLCGIKAAELPENTLLFAKEEQEGISGETPVERTFDYHFVDQLPAPPTEGDGSGWVLTFARYNITVWRRGQEERRMLAVSSPADAYAVYEETSATHADIWVLEDIRKDMHVDTIFISTLSMERHLARHGIYIFHCANMLHNGKSILLSGPSGAGKSTHAELWCRHVEDTRVVNGDRSLICRESDGTYVTDGWPVCGSSEICHNEQHPLGAIVFIEQTPGNQVLPEGLAPHFRRFYAQLTVNHWDAAATAEAADWAMGLCAQVPILTYGCNMAPDAPQPLQQALGELI